MDLPPFVKIKLSREYHVAKWLTEGVEEIAAVDDISAYPIDDLAEYLGWETAARLLWYKTSLLALKDRIPLDLAKLECSAPGCEQPVTLPRRMGPRCANGHGVTFYQNNEPILRACIGRGGLFLTGNA